MSTVILEYIQIFLTIITGGLIIIARKAWSSVDTFFEEKAKNYATKQDIEEITRKTESVQVEFKKIMSLFEADVEFKYKFYEEQYKNLYSLLYCYLSESEAIKKLNNCFDGEIDLGEIPIAEFQTEEKDSLFIKILDLISENKAYASPDLIDLVNAANILTEQYDSELSSNTYCTIQFEIKKRIVSTILIDYNWLREQLKLPAPKNGLKCLEEIKKHF